VRQPVLLAVGAADLSHGPARPLAVTKPAPSPKRQGLPRHAGARRFVLVTSSAPIVRIERAGQVKARRKALLRPCPIPDTAAADAVGACGTRGVCERR
jgi:hypothetical protein